MAAKTNSDIPGDSTPQPMYMALSQPQKDMVDRGIYGLIIQRNAEGYDLTASEMKKLAMSNPFALPGATTRPRSAQVEQEIERLREGYASRVLKHDKSAEAELTSAAKTAPAGAESRRALNAIIRFHGDECGCGGIPMTSATINSLVKNATGQTR